MQFPISLKKDSFEQHLNKKKELLIEAASSILENALYKGELEKLRDVLQISRENIIETYVNYDLDISQNTNSTYESLSLRYVLHLHNLLEGSWHIERQEIMSRFVKEISPSSIIDMGFGVPSRYVKEALQQHCPKITLCDIDDSAIIFAEALLDLWGHKEWRSQISFQKCDMNIGEIIPSHDLYIFQDSIEHVIDCKNYLIKQVENASPTSHFLFSLPIGDITPEHYMEWKSEKEVFNWLISCGLEIIRSKIVSVNPNVDLFADYHDFDYSNCYVVCRKTKNM